MQNVPNLVTCFRICLAPLLIGLAWCGARWPFIFCLSLSFVLDFVDGFLARRLDHSSTLGAKLDTWADLATFGVMPLCAWWLSREQIYREWQYALAGLLMYFLAIAVALLKYGQLTSYHTVGAKLTVVLMGGSMLVLFANGPSWPFRIAVCVLILVELEEIAITAVLREWRPNVPSLWSARRIAREEGSPGAFKSGTFSRLSQNSTHGRSQ